MGETIIINKISVLYLRNRRQKEPGIIRIRDINRNTKNDVFFKINSFDNQVKELEKGY
jgi:hypothetical protein